MNVLTAVFAGMGACIAIGVLAVLEVNLFDVALIMAPFGATTVLVFGLPNSPLAKAKNVIFGHLITATIGIVFTQYIGVSPLTLAVATGLGVTSMLVTDTTHPPAGANPMLIMLTGQGWSFLVAPVLVGAVLIVVIGRIVQSVQRFAIRT